MTMLSVILQNEDELPGVPPETCVTRWATAAADAASAHFGSPMELTVRAVSLEEGRTLNHAFRGKDSATNVLSFPFDSPPGLTLPILGDIAICPGIVTREATEQQKSEEAHWAHMVVHGTLHLLGFDHIEETDAERMEALETRVLTSLGFPDPYRDHHTP